MFRAVHSISLPEFKAAVSTRCHSVATRCRTSHPTFSASLSRDAAWEKNPNETRARRATRSIARKRRGNSSLRFRSDSTSDAVAFWLYFCQTCHNSETSVRHGYSLDTNQVKLYKRHRRIAAMHATTSSYTGGVLVKCSAVCSLSLLYACMRRCSLRFALNEGGMGLRKNRSNATYLHGEHLLLLAFCG